MTKHYASRDGRPAEFRSRMTGTCQACGALEAPTDPPVVVHRPECRIASAHPDRSVEEQAMTATGAIVVGDVWARCVPAREPKTIMVGLVSRLGDGAMMALPVDQGMDAARAIERAHRIALDLDPIDE